jgi:4-oxalocrotonate tautomerase family enzyme
MPLWNVYHPVGAYSAEEKRQFVDRVTRLYASHGLPRFYVVTLFHEVDRGSFHVGGEPVDDRVRPELGQLSAHLSGRRCGGGLRKSSGMALAAATVWGVAYACSRTVSISDL